MFDIGFWEISLIFVLGLLILGPERLPQVARTAGLWLGRARGAMRKLQREIQRELMIEETRAAVEKARREFDDPVGLADREPAAPDAAAQSGDDTDESGNHPDTANDRDARAG